MNICLNKPMVYFYAVLSVLPVLLNIGITPAFAFEKTASLKDFKALQLKSESSEELKGTINFIHSEINKIKKDLKWLSSKIKKMEACKQFVPEKMYKSIKFKKTKIQALTRLKKKHEVLLEKKGVQEPQKKIRITKTKTAMKQTCNGIFLEKKIKQFGLADWLELVKSKNTLRIENRLPILFASASASIAKEYKAFLKNLSSVLKGCNMRIFVDGYADIDPINTKKYPSNFELGAARAANVVHALVKNGISPSVFKIGSTGRYRFAEHKASEWKALERHVNIAIVLEP